MQQIRDYMGREQKGDNINLEGSIETKREVILTSLKPKDEKLT
jgi:hypothetical protein